MLSNILNRRFTAFVCIVTILSICIFCTGRVSAQVSGATLNGTVTDASGAAIPRAQLAITDISTGVVRTAETDSAGFYSVPNLLPAIYEVRVTAPGFSTAVQKGVTLGVGAQQVLNVAMQVGQVSQTVEVTTEVVAVELSSSTVSGDVNPTTVRELPLNGRDWIQLATLQPGIALTRTQASGSSGNANRGSRGYGNQFSGSGHRPYENNFRINGITVNDYANGAPGSVIGGALGVDAIQEFSVLTTNYTAEYGRTTGAIINAITKSGTNTFHGDAYYFMRDEGLDARNYFDPKVIPPFHRNQFGVSGGVPIKKDKSFVFGDYEAIHQAKSLTFSDTVPSPAARGIGPGGSPAVAIVGGSPLPATSPNPDPVTHIDKAVLPYLGFYPLPNVPLNPATPDSGKFNGAGLSTFNENYETARFDQKLTGKDNFAASFYNDRAYFSQPDSLLAVLNASATKRVMISLEETHIFSSSFVNTVRAGFSRSVGQQNIPVSALNPLAANTALGIGGGAAAPTLNPIPGYTVIQGGLGQSSPGTNVINSFQGYDDAFLTRGTHTLKFGFSVEHIQQNAIRSATQPGGRFGFASYTGFLLNQPTSFLVAAQNSVFGKALGVRQTAFGAYIADDWRVRSNLTLNIGLRYEPVTLPTEAHGGFGVLKNIYSGSEQIPVQSLWSRNQTLRNFEPRVGFAWDPFHNGKTSIRGGFGIFDMLPLPWVYYFNTSSSLPFTLQTSVTNTSAVNPLVPGDFPFGAVAKTGFNLANAQTRAVEQNPKANYDMNWNLNVQRQIGSLLVTIGYVGSHSVHQAYTPDDVNMVLPTVTPAGFQWPCGPATDAVGCKTGVGTRLNPLVGPTKFTMWDGSGRYQSLQAQESQKMSHGIQGQLSYTWGKCFDQGSGAQLGDPFQNSLSTFLFFSPKLREGLCDYNVTHTLVGNYVWEIPKPHLESAIAGQVLGGWEVGGIVTFTSGSPYTMVMGGDPLGLNTGGDPKDWPSRLWGTSGCNNPTTGNPNHYLNLDCFSPPTLPAGVSAASLPFPCRPVAGVANSCLNLFGNNGRNSLIGPNLTEFDFSLFKNNYIPRISETFNLQFRAEFFNVLNHPNFQPPFDNNTVFDATGKRINSAGTIDITATDNRQIQFGLKLVW
jgi:hypothetical protein